MMIYDLECTTCGARGTELSTAEAKAFRSSHTQGTGHTSYYENED